MFFKEFFKSKLHIIILIGSALSLFPIIVLIHNAMDLQKAGNIGHANEAFIKDVLSRTITYWPNMMSLIIGLIIWSSNSVISAWAIHNKKVRPVFAYTSLVFGGLLLHLFVIIAYYIGEKYGKGKGLKVRNSIITYSALSFTIIPVAAFIFVISKKSFDDPFVGQKIEISFDENNPNLIEIFADGFDKRFSDDIQKDKSFDDFYVFNKFQTEGTLTHITVPTLYDGFSRNNPFSIALNNGVTSQVEYTDLIYGKHWLDTGLEHLSEKNFPFFGQRTVVNPITLSSNSAYGATSSGTPESIVEKDPKLNVTNWSGARDSNSGLWGISNLSPDLNSFKWFNNNLTTAKAGSKGARVYFPNLITHRPFMNNGNGLFTTQDINYDDNKNVLFNSLGTLIANLKNMENPYAKRDSNGKIDPSEKIKNAYDNSLILIYGDHASHDMLFDEKDQNGNYDELASDVRKTESMMIIKYPQQVSPTNRVINDRFPYSGQLNSIISDYFKNHVGKQDAIDYFKNQKFDKVSRPVFLESNSYVMAEWSNTEDKIVVSNNAKQIFVNYEHNALQKQVNELLDPSKVGYYE